MKCNPQKPAEQLRWYIRIISASCAILPTMPFVCCAHGRFVEGSVVGSGWCVVHVDMLRTIRPAFNLLFVMGKYTGILQYFKEIEWLLRVGFLTLSLLFTLTRIGTSFSVYRKE